MDTVSKTIKTINMALYTMASAKGASFVFSLNVTYATKHSCFIAEICSNDGFDNIVVLQEADKCLVEALTRVSEKVIEWQKDGINPIEKHVPPQNKCQECGIADGSKQPHPCPYQEDVHGNENPYCNCHNNCKERCKEDI